MKQDDVKLSSVNWEHGMLLTPEHFLRQEKYIDSALLWVLRYATNAYGLVGGGPRLAESERGAVRHDPIVVVDEDSEAVHLSVTQCRGLTPAGCIVEIDPEHPLQCQIPKASLEGVAESAIYVVCDPNEKLVVDGRVDPFNPELQTERRPAYKVELQVTADSVPYSIVVGRLRRQKYGAGYEKDSDFIPACTSMSSYSELTSAWRKIVDSVRLLAERYTALHQAMREFLVLFTERGIETATDVETMRFVDRMVAALHDCMYDIIDPVQAPQRFFSFLRRFFHTSAVYLELTPSVQQYFDTLKETGETEFIIPLEQQKQILSTTAKWEVHHDLGVEVRAALQSLNALHRLERALEGKYIDFRISPSLEAMNFIFDRGGKVLFKLSAKPARVQGVGDELTVFFSQLRLEGRDKYRLILVGEQGATFEKGSKIAVEIRINEGSGFRRQPAILSCEVKNADQVNFDFDFDAPDVPTITDFKVSMQAHLPIRTALLFTRHRFYAGMTAETPKTVEPIRQPVEPPVGRVPTPPQDFPPQRTPRIEPPVRSSRLEPPAESRPDPRSDDNRAPWETPPAPRRRRLE